MAPHFVFPQSLKELEEEHEDNRLYAQNHIDISSLRSSELEEFVKGLSLSLFQNSP
jgi:condensin complex subunit 1